MRRQEFLAILLISILSVELSLCFKTLEKNPDLKVGYNVIIDREISQEKAENLARRLKEANCEVVKVWLPTSLLKAEVHEGEYRGWDFSIYDRVLEPIAGEGIEIILEPNFRSTSDMNIPDFREEMLVVREGKRIPFPSLLNERVRKYILSALEAISEHYAEEDVIGEKIIAVNILNEPYFFNFGAVHVFAEENYKIFPLVFMPDENPEYEQDFYWQVEKVAELVKEASDRVKKHLKGTKTMVVADGGFALFPPSAAMYKALWKNVDLAGIDPYLADAEPLHWFFYKMLVDRAKKPVWVTEWNWDDSWWYEWEMPLEFPKEFVERSRDYGVEGTIFFTFNSFGKPGLFALYDVEADEIPPEKQEVYEAVKGAYEKIRR